MEKAATEKAAMEKMAAEKAAADLAMAQKVAAEKAATDKLAAEKAAAEKAAAEKAALAKAAISAAAPTIQKVGTQSWNYIAYRQGANELRQAPGQTMPPEESRGYITVEDNGGRPIFLMVGALVDDCYGGRGAT